MLKSHIGDAKTITIIGLCKNAGKTTAMRQLMTELTGETLALTSVGRDGESTDLVTGTEKPALYVHAGDLFATARGMLSLCDVTCAVEGLTSVMTPLGLVGIFRALSDGYIQLAGPSAAGQLPPLTEQFFALGADRVLIDGAAGRKSLAGAGGCTILCTGASADANMDTVVLDTAYYCRVFQSPQSQLWQEGIDFALFTPKGESLDLPTTPTGSPHWAKLPDTPCALWVSGAVTDPLIQVLARRKSPVHLITHDATHVLASRPVMERFWRNGGQLSVRQPLTVAAVCANPWSAYGYHFPPDAFLSALQTAIDLPVLNIRQEVQP